MDNDKHKPRRGIGWRPENAADHYAQCPACGGWFDMRDLGQAFDHVGPLPHHARQR